MNLSLSNPITILLADDHNIVRQGLRALLAMERSFRVVGEAATGRSAVELATILRPDVILMDIAMPELNGLEATRRILAGAPAAKVLVLSAYGDDAQVDGMIAAGAAGFVKKQISAEVLIDAIREVAEGKIYFDPDITKRLRGSKRLSRGRNGSPTAQAVHLSPREAKVLPLAAGGSHHRQIGRELGISIKKVGKHRKADRQHISPRGLSSLGRAKLRRGIGKGEKPRADQAMTVRERNRLSLELRLRVFQHRLDCYPAGSAHVTRTRQQIRHTQAKLARWRGKWLKKQAANQESSVAGTPWSQNTGGTIPGGCISPSNSQG
jgi:DNA-binding NarL/FixJ family response regulator